MEDLVVMSDAAEARDVRIGNWLAEGASLRSDLYKARQEEDSYEMKRLEYHIGRVEESLQNGFGFPKGI